MFGFKKKRIEFDELPEDVQEELDLVEITLMEGGEATDTFRKISKKYPGFIPARLNLASMLLDSGKTSESLSIYEKVLKDFPEELGAIAGVATVLSAKKEHEKAVEFAYRALNSGYKWSPCYEVIAKAKASEGDKNGEADAYLSGYRLSPHSWSYLEKFCNITKRNFASPTESASPCITTIQLKSLIDAIEEMANSPDSEGNILGCNHTFRFTESWAENNNVDIIQLYQFLNANGGFCDCEVCFNVSELLYEDDE